MIHINFYKYELTLSRFSHDFGLVELIELADVQSLFLLQVSSLVVKDLLIVLETLPALLVGVLQVDVETGVYAPIHLARLRFIF